MKRGLLIALLLLGAGMARAQSRTDSLRKVLASDLPYEQRIGAALRLAEAYQLSHFDSAILIGEEGVQLASSQGDSLRMAQLKRFIGTANYFSGKYDLAARNFIEAISILERGNNKKELAPVYNDLAKLYRKTRDLDKALVNYNKSDAIYRQLKDTAGMAMILNESGVVFEYRGDYAQALDRYSRSLQLGRASGDSLSVSYSLSNIAGVYVIQKDYEPAIRNLQQALRIREQLSDSFALALNYSDLGAAYNASGDFSKAIGYLLASNRIAEKLRYPELMANNYNELSSAASRQGDYRQAFGYFTKRAALRDSLFNLEKTKEIERLSSEYETAKKEQLIREQHQRIRLQNYLLGGAAILLLLSGLLLYSNYKRHRLKKESRHQAALILQQEQAARAILEAEENERQRIARDLHDGVGQMMSAAKMNLSAFESEINFSGEKQKEAFQRIITLVDESCREVRTVSHIMMPNALLKNNLASAIREFVNKLSHKDLKVQVYTEGLEDRLDSNVETVLYRVIQESVHNAIKHSGASHLDISLIRDKEGISGTVEDNGKGFDIRGAAAQDGIGLKNIRSRIGYLKGTVQITSEPGRGTLVAFHVPL